jgi:hypothetical protein
LMMNGSAPASRRATTQSWSFIGKERDVGHGDNDA